MAQRPSNPHRHKHRTNRKAKQRPAESESCVDLVRSTNNPFSPRRGNHHDSGYYKLRSAMRHQALRKSKAIQSRIQVQQHLQKQAQQQKQQANDKEMTSNCNAHIQNARIGNNIDIASQKPVSCDIYNTNRVNLTNTSQRQTYQQPVDVNPNEDAIHNNLMHLAQHYHSHSHLVTHIVSDISSCDESVDDTVLLSEYSRNPMPLPPLINTHRVSSLSPDEHCDSMSAKTPESQRRTIHLSETNYFICYNGVNTTCSSKSSSAHESSHVDSPCIENKAAETDDDDTDVEDNEVPRAHQTTQTVPDFYRDLFAVDLNGNVIVGAVSVTKSYKKQTNSKQRNPLQLVQSASLPSLHAMDHEYRQETQTCTENVFGDPQQIQYSLPRQNASRRLVFEGIDADTTQQQQRHSAPWNVLSVGQLQANTMSMNCKATEEDKKAKKKKKKCGKKKKVLKTIKEHSQTEPKWETCSKSCELPTKCKSKQQTPCKANKPALQRPKSADLCPSQNLTSDANAVQNEDYKQLPSIESIGGPTDCRQQQAIISKTQKKKKKKKKKHKKKPRKCAASTTSQNEPCPEMQFAHSDNVAELRHINTVSEKHSNRKKKQKIKSKSVSNSLALFVANSTTDEIDDFLEVMPLMESVADIVVDVEKPVTNTTKTTNRAKSASLDPSMTERTQSLSAENMEGKQAETLTNSGSATMNKTVNLKPAKTNGSKIPSPSKAEAKQSGKNTPEKQSIMATESDSKTMDKKPANKKRRKRKRKNTLKEPTPKKSHLEMQIISEAERNRKKQYLLDMVNTLLDLSDDENMMQSVQPSFTSPLLGSRKNSALSFEGEVMELDTDKILCGINENAHELVSCTPPITLCSDDASV